MTEQAKAALKKIENWRGEFGMPAEYIDWAVASELVKAGAVRQESPGPGWGLYLIKKEA